MSGHATSLAQLRRLALPLVPALPLLAALAGCGGGGAAAERDRLACPRPAIVDELASFERHLPPGAPERPENLAYRAALEGIDGTCAASGRDLNVTVSVDVLVEPGPAFAGPSVEVPYFVAVVDGAGEVVDRQDYVARVPVAPGAKRGATRETFSQRFVGQGPRAGAGYQLLFGFALPRDEALRRAPSA